MPPLSRPLPHLAAAALLTVYFAAAPGVPADSAPAPRADLAARTAAQHRIARDVPRTDLVRAGQWQLSAMQAEQAWALSTGAGVVVAVIDSGVSADHPDLMGKVLPGRDFVAPEGGDGTLDAVGHGTTVAALIAGHADPEGVAGLAPGALILPVRVLDEQNRYRDARVVAEAVVWAVDHGADIINLSLGGTVASPALAEAIDYAFAGDVVVVACVGNILPGGPAEIWYPAREPGVLAVTATTSTGQIWDGSLTGEYVVLAAPGTNVMGARPDGYWHVQGTSFAAPLVSATAALVRSRWPDMSAANVVQRLITTAHDRGENGRDDAYGFGVVDPVAALSADIAMATGNPLDTTGPPGRQGFGSVSELG